MLTREVLSDARLYVKYWSVKNNGINVNDLDSIQLDLIADVYDYNIINKSKKKIKPIKALSRQIIEAAVNELIRKEPTRKRLLLAENLKTEQENLEPLREWVKAVTGKVDDDDLYIMAHWIWLVKRNAMQCNVVHHIMPIVTSSKQGGGKTTAVKKLLEPVAALSMELKVPQVVDERAFTMFTEYLVGFFDEMAGADKVEISDFKRNVTTSTLMYRPMRTNSMVALTNRCTFIGASNNQVYEIIKDTTGLRRFFPIQALDLLNHEAINSIDYTALWKGIDERLERGYYERVKDTVAVKQEALALKDEVQVFLEDFHIHKPTDKHILINGKRLFENYILHMRNSGVKFNVTAQVFYKKLRDMGYIGTQKFDEKRNRSWFFAINPEHGLFQEKEKS